MNIVHNICLQQHKQLWALATEGLTMPVAYAPATRDSFNSIEGWGGD